MEGRGPAVSSTEDAGGAPPTATDWRGVCSVPIGGLDRGQVMIFTLMMLLVVASISFTVLQTQVSPAVERRTEARHYAVVRSDFQTLRNQMVGTALDGTTANTMITMGSDYPSFLLLIHPPGPSGRLQTTVRRPVKVTNVQAADPDVQDLLQAQGSPNTITVQSRGLAYTPTYRQFPAPTLRIWPMGVVIADLSNGTRAVTGQRLIRSRRLTLVNMSGSLAVGQTSPLSLQTVPLSGSSQRITVVENDDTPVNLRIPTQLSQAPATAVWKDLLQAERDPTTTDDCQYDQDTEYVCGITFVENDADTVQDNRVVIKLEYDPDSGENVRYRLAAALVGIKTQSQPQPSSATTPRYLVPVTTDQMSVPAGSSQQLRVELRDRYHNPVAGRPAHAEVTSNPTAGQITDTETLTNRRGQATYVFEAQTDTDEQDEQVTVTVWLGTGNTQPSEPRKKVTFNITVQDAPGQESP